jgi:hypothetical protein
MYEQYGIGLTTASQLSKGHPLIKSGFEMISVIIYAPKAALQPTKLPGTLN